MPKDWYILKVAQRCNLNCDYCYVYNRGDESWRLRPKLMSDAVLSVIIERIIHHRDPGRTITLELHGGEPLLYGLTRMKRALTSLRERLGYSNCNIVLQTNGLLLTKEWVDLFEGFEVYFGISLDGAPQFADLHRKDLRGHPTTSRVLAAIDSAREHPAFARLFSGILCVVNPEQTGRDAVNWFYQNGFRKFSFLLPDGNLANPPQISDYKKITEYLIEAFDTWVEHYSAEVDIRLFRQILLSFMGVRPGLDSLGEDISGMVVIETNGAMIPHDVIRLCGTTFQRDELFVQTHEFDAVDEHYHLARHQEPSAQCRKCDAFRSCGGGYLAHRYDGVSFQNASYYCSSLYALSLHIRQYLRSVVPPQFWSEYRRPV